MSFLVTFPKEGSRQLHLQSYVQMVKWDLSFKHDDVCCFPGGGKVAKAKYCVKDVGSVALLARFFNL